MKSPRESGCKFPGATMGVSNEKKVYGQILKKNAVWLYIVFITKNS